MIDELLLLSKNDIPFIEAQVKIHQPTIREIALIGEEAFFSGIHLLNFSKSLLNPEDKRDLESLSDFEVFMSIMRSSERMQSKNNAKMVLALLFPNSEFQFMESELILFDKENLGRINQNNYDTFKEIIVSMFCLNDIDDSSADYQPVDKRAQKIAEKLKKGKEKIRSLKNEEKSDKIAVFSRYVSILAVGECKDMNTLLDYSVFQLKDEFQRFQNKQSFDIYIKAKMAGASDLEDVDNWMDDIHP